MRIITGMAKGCKLRAPKGDLTRPTADRVKESLFNILGQSFTDKTVLDLFAGTGNLGLEALSRGAHSAVFVDQNEQSIQTIRFNAAHTKLIGRCEIIKSEAFSVLSRFGRSARQFDLIFCDPPYRKELALKTLAMVDSLSILRPGGIIVVEQAKDEPFSDDYDNLRLLRSQKYGETMIYLYEMIEKAGD